MTMGRLKSWLASAVVSIAAAVPLATDAAAQDKVKVGVFAVASSLPYFVALERGYFKEQNIEPETVRLVGGPPIVAALIADQIDAASVLVTIEGMNANLKKPGAAVYITLNSQSQNYPMEQFVIRDGFAAKSLKDLKGAKILSAPGPANVLMAKAALEANGLKEGDYRLDQLDTAQHLGALKAGSFDAGYTLEPNATVMRRQGVATTLENGVIARYVLGDPKANAFVGGGVLSTRFITERPDVARRYAAAWTKAIRDIQKDPDGARRHLLKNTLTPDDVVNEVPMLGYFVVSELSDARQEGVPGLHRFLDEADRRHGEGRDVEVHESLLTGGLVLAKAPAAAARAVAGDAGAPHVTVRGLRKSFGATTIYGGFDLDVPRGRFVSIFGPNGCGKSTLINLIAGLLPADGGEIRIGGKPVRDTRIGYVFQNYREALFPWLRALDNIEYPLKIARVPRGERRRGSTPSSRSSTSRSIFRATPTSFRADSSSSSRSCGRSSSSPRCFSSTSRSRRSTTR